jgi:hypothetical protein
VSEDEEDSDEDSDDESGNESDDIREMYSDDDNDLTSTGAMCSSDDDDDADDDEFNDDSSEENSTPEESTDDDNEREKTAPPSILDIYESSAPPILGYWPTFYPSSAPIELVMSMYELPEWHSSYRAPPSRTRIVERPSEQLSGPRLRESLLNSTSGPGFG